MLVCIESYQTTVNVTSHFKTGKSSCRLLAWHSSRTLGVSQKSSRKFSWMEKKIWKTNSQFSVAEIVRLVNVDSLGNFTNASEHKFHFITFIFSFRRWWDRSNEKNRSRGFFPTGKKEKIKCQCNAIFHYFPYGKYRITKSTHKNSLLLQLAIVVISANREERSKQHGNCTQSESREFWLGVFCPSEHFVHKNREKRAAHNINFTINFSVSLVIYNLQSL